MKSKDEKIDYKYNFKIYFELLSRYKWISIFLLFVVLLIEVSDVVRIYLFKIVTDNGAKFVAGGLIKNEFVGILMGVLVVYIVLFLSRATLEWLHIHFINIIDSYLMADIKRKFFNHLIHLHYGFHTSHRTGSLISKLLRGGSSIEKLTDSIVFNFVPLTFGIFVIGASILYFDKLSALIIVITVTLFVFYSLFMQHIQEKSSIRANENEDYEKGVVSDIFTNIDSIKYFGREFDIKNKYKKISETTRIGLLDYWKYYRWLSGGHSLILSLGTLALIYFPLVRFLNNEITLGTLVFIYTSFVTVTGLLFRFVYGIRNFYSSMADFQSLFKYDKIQNEIKNIPNAKDLKIKNGEIEFRNVSFSYKKNKLFNHFNLKIPKNKRIALVGHSGSGKTTLVRLLYRLYDVDSGEILIDGNNIKNFRQESLRSELSIVPQECILFDETIYNNVSFSNPKASRDEIIKSMKNSQLYEIVNKLPNKEKTIVGERGVKLSGGEKQRVSLARALLANKKILVMDEPTSSLDSKTENEIQKSLSKLMENRTTIIIAHRLSTIMNSDIIVVIDKGKIVQKGTHNQLINKKGTYKELWELQKGGYII